MSYILKLTRSSKPEAGVWPYSANGHEIEKIPVQEATNPPEVLYEIHFPAAGPYYENWIIADATGKVWVSELQCTDEEEKFRTVAAVQKLINKYVEQLYVELIRFNVEVEDWRRKGGQQ